jgi:hypothetical protein
VFVSTASNTPGVLVDAMGKLGSTLTRANNVDPSNRNQETGSGAVP